MIISRQFQSQQSVFYAKNVFSNGKAKLNSSALEHAGYKERQKFKKNIVKRSSCHNITADDRQNEAGKFSNKFVDHILTQLKQKQKASREKNSSTIIHAMSQKKNQKQVYGQQEEVQQLNQQNNLKIKSISDLIDAKKEATNRLKTYNIPFQNKKLMNLRRGKSHALYTQQIQPSALQPTNEVKILPWDFYNNHIIDLPGATHQNEDQTMQQNYLKSHNLKKESKAFTKYSTLAFSLPEQRKTSLKKFSSIDVRSSQKPKVTTTNCTQIFSAHSIRERAYKPMRHRGKNENIKRTLTEMKMDISQIQLHKPEIENMNKKNIKIQEFFEFSFPKNVYPRKPPISHHLYKPAESLPRESSENMVNCFLIGRKI